jgi:radical SAM superfamily enzyme YgiQ (UPF0313 family)
MPASGTALSVLLIGFQDQDNLGLRYLMSAVCDAQFKCEIMTYKSDPDPIIDRIKKSDPMVIGFSLIFQYMAPDFGNVISAIRRAGIDAHITMGGHYPSFDYEEVLDKIPGLDSIVRYEGESTLVHLVQKLHENDDWESIPGIAFRRNGQAVSNPLRAPISDLDTLPLPYRNDIDYESDAMPTASLLASRGCPWDCSFCSIRPFYEAQGGALRRFRKPRAVVEEMEALYRERAVQIFLFQDDDFMAGGRRAALWAEEIAKEIRNAGLTGKVAFKISCRSDEIHHESMAKLVDAGLCHVYMGVESGDNEGLVNLNKRLTADRHIRAGRILKSLGLSFDFGFMLLEPYSTFDIVRNNMTFLEEFVGDGWSVASFCRMLPYAGTPIKDKLQAEGRLLGTAFEPDYRFLDPRLDVFYDWMLETFYERNFTNRGLCHILKSLLFEAHLKLSGCQVFDSVERSCLHHLTAIANSLAISTMRSAIAYIESAPMEELREHPAFLRQLTLEERIKENALLRQVADLNWSARHKQSSVGSHYLGAFDKSWTVA